MDHGPDLGSYMIMTRQIYRQAALDRLASPEQLDRPYKLVGSLGWLLLLGLFAVILAGGAWAMLADAPVKVQGKGIVLQRGGLREIVSDTAGRIKTLGLVPGQVIEAGVPVVLFQRSDRLRELRQAQAALVDAQSRLAALSNFYADLHRREEEAEARRLASIAETRETIVRRRDLLEVRLKDLTSLVERKIVLQEKIIDVELDLANARERLATLDNEANALELRKLDRESKQRLALLDERLKIERQERTIARLRAGLAEDKVILSPYPGQVVEVKVNSGDVVAAGTPIAMLAPTADEAADTLGVIYVSPTDGKRIRPGMEAEIVPSIYRREEYGFIRAKVVSVSPVPATAEGMRRVVKNDRLVTQLSGGGAPFEVRVHFDRDASVPSGLQWSASKGPPGAIAAGNLIDAAILVDRKPIANLLVPGLDTMLGLKGGG